ncbi:hypothetical protein [uncultured Pseudodesulfovibrio sp.]|uniref:TolB family protein n=1 Tax=uncultured Pseudodesulfovibrio sp. TaxID=2035858 RepID=UPI0029C8B09F|nr:hypothetical protein [uncultured Pseudodesulfovibrio sp.]
MMRHRHFPWLPTFVLPLLILCAAFVQPVAAYPLFRSIDIQVPHDLTLKAWIDSFTPVQSPKPVLMLEPIDGALVPANAASPIIRWKDPANTVWLITVSIDGNTVCRGIMDATYWIPSQLLWERIRSSAGTTPISVTVFGVSESGSLSTKGQTSFSVSDDPVGTHIGFLRKRLPFRKAKDNPHDSQMAVGDLTSSGKPRIVLQDQPICFNCHAYSPDGKSYGMDMDYKGDKGGYALVDISKKVSITDNDIISWNDYKAPGPSKYSMGLFTTFSPDGRYAASTVGESSAFIMLDDLHFSQMFYPATGQIAYYDRTTGKVLPLKGADTLEAIQTNPAFSADGKRVTFARATVKPDLVADIETGKLRKEDPGQSILDANEKYPMQFDLYSVPFNDGLGGTAVPVDGASANGMSNFFPRYSPNGKWLVFTQCKTGLVLQPDSRLVIIPAEGGTPRILKANTDLMNSWHSWSSNSRWLVFSSKGNSPFTEIYLTHIDGNGESSPPLRLFRFSHTELAAMVPEFIPNNSIIQRTMVLADPEGAQGESMATDGR